MNVKRSNTLVAFIFSVKISFYKKITFFKLLWPSPLTISLTKYLYALTLVSYSIRYHIITVWISIKYLYVMILMLVCNDNYSFYGVYM